MTNPEKAMVMRVVECVRKEAAGLPYPERADLYHGLSICLQRACPDIAEAAGETAKALRDAETKQLLFAELH